MPIDEYGKDLRSKMPMVPIGGGECQSAFIVGKGYISSVKVFSETKYHERETMGDKIGKWFRAERPEIVSYEVRQSSDSEFHCLSIIFFYRSTK